MDDTNNHATTDQPTIDPQASLTSRTFLALVVTQLLGALNDNMLRWLIVPIAKYKVGEDFTAAALSAGLACFVLPYILLAAPAGYLADRFPKRQVIIGCKLAELILMAVAIAAIWYGNVYLLFVVVFLMGSQSALFGPSKFGSIPEVLRPDKISSGNGVIALTTVISVVAGTIAGNYLYDITQPDGRSLLWISALALLGVAAMGLFASLFVARSPAADPSRKIPWNMARQAFRDLKILGSNVPLFRVAMGVAFFWSLASLAQLNVDLFGITILKLEQIEIGPLLAVLSLGVGLGSVLAGYLSGGRVELGLVPLGALGIAISSMLLVTVPDPIGGSGAAKSWTCLWLFLLGSSAGLFDVPLQAFMQHRSPAQSRGSILAAGNFLTFSGMLMMSVVFYVLQKQFGLSAREIFLASGAVTLLVAAYAFLLLPQATIRFLVWLATHTIYRVRVEGRDNLPETGGALLVANHVSWLDGVLLLVTSSRPVRIIVDAKFTGGSGWRRWLTRTMQAIPIGSTPEERKAALQSAREALQQGELVCIFPEGSISRSGHLAAFKGELMEIIQGSPAPVVPVYLNELWGSIFSFYGGKFFWKWPKRVPYPVSIWFGKPLTQVTDITQVRQAVQDLGAEAVQEHMTRSMTLPRRFLRECRRRLFRTKISDSSGAALSGGSLLMRTLILRRLLLREVLDSDEKYIGILLPPSTGGVVVNAAVTLAGRVSANLNYTVTSSVMNSCISQAGIRHVLTSRRVTEKLDIEFDSPLIYLEDVKEKLTLADKLIAAFQAYLLPVRLLERKLGLTSTAQDEVLTVIFTSGSTGEPKGVLLTQENILSNTLAIDQVVHLRSDDVIVGVLPFFHSFGYTVTLWTVLGLDVKGAYHFTPLDARQVGKLCESQRGTILLATPTFLRSYIKRCTPEQFAALEVVVVGAEKMALDLADSFEAKFGVRPVEGFGATELSPLVSVNVPPSRSVSEEVDLKEGTVGRPVPGVSAKIVDPDTYEDLPQGTPGMLLICGPNVMQGYLGLEEKTAEVLRDGWYVTGDIAKIDADGFITITSRLSRFSKIGGEMVPHLKIEEEILTFLGGEQETVPATVTAVPDERKGERLIVLITREVEQTPEVICQHLAGAGLPNLWIPSQSSFIQVDEIPHLGTGKLDLRAIKQLAAERCGDQDTK